MTADDHSSDDSSNSDPLSRSRESSESRLQATDTTRRALLAAGSAGSITGALSTLLSEGALATTNQPSEEAGGGRRPTDDRTEEVFPLSVASGDPSPSGVVLWTRIAPDEYRPDRDLRVVVAADKALDDVVFTGSVGAEAIRPMNDYTVKVDLDGHLGPDREYHYQFAYGDVASRVGRTRTLPAPDADVGEVRFGVFNCQAFSGGYYGAYDYVAGDDVDVLLHLGDLIYEYDMSSEHEGRDVNLPSGKGVAHTLADFRHIHRRYRDASFQRALEQHPIVPTWDDHEVVNDRFWDYEEDAPAANDHPRSGDTDFMRRLHAAATKAWWEYLPTRVFYDPGEPGTAPLPESGSDDQTLQDRFRLYRRLQFGNLVDLFVTDERLYRDPPPENTDTTDNGPEPVRSSENTRFDEDRTMLGGEQLSWFKDGLAQSETTWQVWASSLRVMPLQEGFDRASRASNDPWSGYVAERKRITRHAQDVTQNFVALTGDVHAFVVGYLQHDYRSAPKERTPTDEENRVGVEFLNPALTSGSSAGQGFTAKLSEEAYDRAYRQMNPHLEWINGSRNGYSILTFTDTAATYDAFEVDKTVKPAEAERRLLRRYRVPEGEVKIQEFRRSPADELVGALADEPPGPAKREGRDDPGQGSEQENIEVLQSDPVTAPLFED